MKRGLVLCGGGSKGSYEMGAWRALKELNINFDIVTGTSIGCLNAAMYCQNDYDRCLELWNKIEVGMIMESGFNFENNGIKNALKGKKDFFSFFSKYVANMGTDIKPFLNLMDEYIDEDKIINSKIIYGICCAKFPSKKGYEVVANTLDKKYIKKYLLASASCFPIFPVCKIDKESYIDGGYYDNLPINFAINLGAKEIVAIDLNPNLTHKEYVNKPFIKYVRPTRSLGSFMLFDRNVINNNMLLGYYDIMKAYNKYKGYRYIFKVEEENSLLYKNFLFEISNIYALIKRNFKRSVVKTNVYDVFDILEMYSLTKMSNYDYFLRAIEVMAEILNIDYLEVYTIESLTKKIVQTISEINTSIEVLDGYSILKPNKKRDFLLKSNELDLVAYLSKHIFANKEIDNELLINLALTKPNVFISIVFIKNIMQSKGWNY